MRRSLNLLLCLCLLALSACYNPPAATPDVWDGPMASDSVSFYSTHHYSQGYNFQVTADSVSLVCQQPDELPFDSVVLRRGDHIVVAEVMTIARDEIDSIWIKVARDQLTQGWTRESQLLKAVSPADPISRFIDMFSNTHLLLSLALVVTVSAVYGLRLLMRRRARIVHLNDIDSPFPALLCVSVAAAATLYATLQMTVPDMWRHFYYHPSLNPFAVPLPVGLFIALLWMLLLVALAALYDVLRLLASFESLLYLVSLACVCSVAYVVFSFATLYYVGFLLLPLYAWMAFRLWHDHPHSRYVCGHCGAPLVSKGVCPACGALNE